MRKLLIFLVSLVLVVGCKRHEELSYGNEVEVQVAPSLPGEPLGAPSRAASYTYFAAGDSVGLYMVSYIAPATPGILLSVGNHANNERFVANAAGTLTKAPPVYYPLKLTTNLVDIYAYHPYTKTVVDVNNIPFEVKSNQSKGLTVSDLCWAKNIPGKETTGIEPSASPVAMEFVHKLSKIEVKLTLPATGVDGKTIKGVKDVKINGIKRGTTLNLATGVATTVGAGLAEVITPYNSQVGIPVTKAYVYSVIAPAQTFNKGLNIVDFVVVYADDSESWFAYKVTDATFDTYGMSIAEAKVHILNISLTPGFEVRLDGSTIVDWTEGTTVNNGRVDNFVTTTFKVTTTNPDITTANRVVVTTDFDGSYDIKSGVVVNAGVCTFGFTDRRPMDYGFRIVKLEFFAGETSLGAVEKKSNRVYTQGLMDLGTWSN